MLAASLTLTAIVVFAGGGAGPGLDQSLRTAATSHDTPIVPAIDYPNNGVSPPPTALAGAAFDGADGYVLMFGGTDDSNSPVAGTWSFARNNWTDLSSVVGVTPSARYSPGMAYDAADGYVLLFGGCFDYAACSRVAGDTWSYAHGHWTNLTSSLTVSPPARGKTQMVYDAAAGAVVLFGGLGAQHTYLNDTWTFQGGRWTEVGGPSFHAPSARANGMMAYDPPEQSVVLFGGYGAQVHLADTWTFHSGTWTNVTAASAAAPSPRAFGGMTFDATDGYLLLVNGYVAGNYLGDEWEYSGGTWSLIAPANAPPGTFGSLLVFDATDGYVLFFSGAAYGGYLTSTFVFVGGAWTLLINPPGSGPSLGFVLLILLVILAPIAVGVLVGGQIRRRRERTLAEGFQLPPSEVVRWIATGPASRSTLVVRFLPLVIVVVVLVPVWAIALSGGDPLLALVLTVFLVILMGGTTYAVWSQLPREIGVVSAGVIVRRKVGEMRVPWSQLQPAVSRPNRGIFWFQTILPGREQAVGGFQADAEQARAIVLSPFAPPWVLTQPFADGLGVPAQRGPAPPVAPPVVYRPAELPPGATPSTLPPSSPTVSWPLGRIPPSYSQPPAPTAPVTSASPPGPPLGTVACPNCGQINPAASVVFCRSCGRRLRA